MNAREERGQAFLMTVVFLTVLLGVAALAIDVGSWFHAKRQLQAAADAAALAGAQALPESPADASALAIQYAADNGHTLGASGISFSTDIAADDTITVQMSAPEPGFFSKLFGIGTVTVGAHASARSDNIDEALHASPIGVNLSHPDLSGQISGTPCPCFGVQTTLTLNKVGPGGFKLLDIDGSFGGINPHTLGDWMTNGLDAWMPLGQYYSDSGAKFNSPGVTAGLDANMNKELLFPVYDTVISNGSNLEYHVIGWVGFHLTGYLSRGNSGDLYGYFTRVIWQGLQGQRGGGGASDFGARAVQLVN